MAWAELKIQKWVKFHAHARPRLLLPSFSPGYKTPRNDSCDTTSSSSDPDEMGGRKVSTNVGMPSTQGDCH